MLKKHISIGIICIFMGLLFSSSIIADNQDEELIETNLFSYGSLWEYNDSVEDRCIEIPAISNSIQNILGNPDLIPTNFTIIQNGDDNNISIECLSGFGLRIKIVNTGNTTIEFVNISIILDGPFLFVGGGTFNTGTYLEFTPGSIITIGALVFGIGSINVTVYVNDYTKSGSGYLFGPFVLFND